MSRRSDAVSAPRPLDALLLGLIQGPTELLPVSSSGHTTLVPWLLGLPYAQLDGERRKAIEVSLHAGTAAALVIKPPHPPGEQLSRPRGTALGLVMLTPTTAAALASRRLIVTRLGTPATIVSGLLAGSAALAAANRAPGRRRAVEATPSDAAIIGAAQSASLWPGVSRFAMAIASARALGFDAGSAAEVARCGLIPSALAGSAFETTKVLREGRAASDGPAMAVAFTASFGSTLASRGLVSLLERGGSLLPFALWRCSLALLALLRIRRLGDDGSR